MGKPLLVGHLPSSELLCGLRGADSYCGPCESTWVERKSRYALNLPENTTDEELDYPFETEQINLGPSCLWGIPKDELPE